MAAIKPDSGGVAEDSSKSRIPIGWLVEDWNSFLSVDQFFSSRQPAISRLGTTIYTKEKHSSILFCLHKLTTSLSLEKKLQYAIMDNKEILDSLSDLQQQKNKGEQHKVEGRLCFDWNHLRVMLTSIC